MQQLGWATCQRLSPNPDTLFYKFSNDVPVHRLFLHLRCDERSTLTHPVPSVWHASSRYTDSTNLPYPRLYISSKVTHIQQPPSFLPPGYYGLLSCIKITRLGSSSQSTMCWLIRAESSLALGKVCFYILNSLFLKNSFQVPWGVRVESMPIAYPHWTYLFVCLVCLGVVLLFLVGNKWSSSTPSYISNSVNKGESICLNQSDRAYNRGGEFISWASRRSV